MAGVQHNRDYFYEYQSYLKSLGGDNSGSRKKLIANLRRAIAEELTEKERTALVMYYVQEMKMVDIALRLGKNVSTVSRNIQRAKGKLRRCLRYGAKELLEADEDK